MSRHQAVSVAELRRAWVAVTEGQFRTHGPRPNAAWSPPSRTVLVCGAIARAGASCVALAIATATPGTRLIEGVPASRSGLVAASVADHGTRDGWQRSTRDYVTIDRPAFDSSLDGIPTPTGTVSGDVVVVDAGWTIPEIAASSSWLTGLLGSRPIVVVTAGTVPGLRALDTALGCLPESAEVWAVVVGLRRGKWPRTVATSLTPRLRAIEDDGRLLVVEQDLDLAFSGVGVDPLPTSLLAAGRELADATGLIDLGGAA